ncbi:MAG: nucleotidyltransferase family protein [Clostridia bacterium]|nr:nucleotidyltransferase family protein [Clostridia bacterium]
MKTAGIVAEFNPFHNGHKYLIDSVRSAGATHVIAVMSSSFVQRGEPSVYDTSVRVKAALEGGVDLVLQLPVTKTLSSAKEFAFGAVDTLVKTGVVDTLAFGSECGDISLLTECASLIDSDEINASIREYLSSGITFAAAREKAVRDIGNDLGDLLAQPNNILAVEYIRALSELKADMELFTVKRQGADHDSSDMISGFAGAKQIRKMIYSDEDFSSLVPDYSIYENGKNLLCPDKLDASVLCRLRMMTAEKIGLAPDVSEGIENRILDSLRKVSTLEELYSEVKTKRYTHARIRRIVMNSFLGITAELSALPVPYIRILGMNKKGAELASAMKKSASLPIVSKTADTASLGSEARNVFEAECRATDVRSLCLENPVSCGKEKSFRVIIR